MKQDWWLDEDYCIQMTKIFQNEKLNKKPNEQQDFKKTLLKMVIKNIYLFAFQSEESKINLLDEELIISVKIFIP